MTRVVVIGAGLLGSSVADELAGLGADVTVLETGRPGAGTSGSSFAWINAQDKAPAAYFDLNVEGMTAYPSLARELGGDWFHAGGDIAIGRGPAAAKLLEKVARQRAAGYAVQELDRAGVAALEPDLALPADGELAAAHFPNEGWIDAPALVERRLARAAERGAQVRAGTAVEGFDVDGGRVTAVRTSDGPIEADAVLLAAGPASERLAGLAGVTLPMAPNPGLLVTTARVAARLSHIIHAGDVAMRPDGGGRILLSSRGVDAELDPATRQMAVTAEPVLELLARGTTAIPALAGAAVDRVRIGVRSVASDGLPVAGFAPGVENLYLLVAHSGATLAPVLGRIVAAELTSGPDARFDGYRPGRFA